MRKNAKPIDADKWRIIARKDFSTMNIDRLDLPKHDRANVIDVIPRIKGTNSNTQKAMEIECAAYNLNIEKNH